MKPVPGKPAISVVIPTFNRAASLTRCLDSLVAQTFKDFEVLVCDDGSTDNTVEVVAAFKDRLNLHYFYNENFGGPARPRNMGIRHAQSAIIAFLDSDNWWTPDKLEKCLPCFYDGADVVYHTLYRVTGEEVQAHRSVGIRQVKKPVYEDLLMMGNTLPTSGTLVRSTLIRQIGGFREITALIAWEDFDCWLRLARISENFSCVNLPLGYYWFGGGNITTAHRILHNLDAMKKHYFLNKQPWWYFERKSLALFQLGDYSRAFRQKVLAFWYAPAWSLKWNVVKTSVRWLFFLKR